MQDHEDPLVQAESTVCLQELHLFTPRHVNLTALVWTLCVSIYCNYILFSRCSVFSALLLCNFTDPNNF